MNCKSLRTLSFFQRSTTTIISIFRKTRYTSSPMVHSTASSCLTRRRMFVSHMMFRDGNSNYRQKLHCHYNSSLNYSQHSFPIYESDTTSAIRITSIGFAYTGINSNTTIRTSSTTSSIPQQNEQQHTYVVSTCRQLYNSIIEFNNGIKGPLLPYTNQSIKLPMVLCVGNHSSGKSSFINYVLGRAIQTAGVAPTDDSFTIIAPNNAVVDSNGKQYSSSENCNTNGMENSSKNDYDQDGFAIIGNPDYGFTSLRQFGPTLQHHTVFKLRSNINSNFIIVDSPGMIDAPSNYSLSGNYSTANNNSSMDRGYDFTGVVKWYADRADVVLLFFDPDKPGTTGETLSILINALSNIDHKLFIIFNKADRFMNQQIHDFARAYGSLCWNLSKVIPRKDLPRIYTMCLPVSMNSSSSSSSVTNNNSTTMNGNEESVTDPIPPGLQDLYDAREEVVAQVRKAPERRLDNVITNLYDSISLLHMYARIVQDVQQRYYRTYWSSKYQELLLLSSGMVCSVGCATYGVPVLGLPIYSTAILGSITVLSTASVFWYNSHSLRLWEYHNCTSTELYNAFTRLYAYEIMNGNESVAHTWTQIRDQLSITLQPTSVSTSSHSIQFRNGIGDTDTGAVRKLAIVTDKDLQKLHSILLDDIPLLRRHVSPATTTPTASATTTLVPK